MNVQPQLRRQLYEAQLGEAMRRAAFEDTRQQYKRVDSQPAQRVRCLMLDGRWRTLDDICAVLGVDTSKTRAVYRSAVDHLVRRGVLESELYEGKTRLMRLA